MTQEELNKKLLDAVRINNISEVEEAMSLGADVNSADDNGETALTVLMEACEYGHTDIVKLLLKSGAGSNISNNDGDTVSAKPKKKNSGEYKNIQNTIRTPVIQTLAGIYRLILHLIVLGVIVKFSSGYFFPVLYFIAVYLHYVRRERHTARSNRTGDV